MPVEGRSSDRLVGLVRDRLPKGQTIGVALSGGGDSIALLHLAVLAGLRVEAVTVDHSLRPESADEAASVADVCARLGVPHSVRVWEHGAVPGNLMDRARRARMVLIAAWARERGIAHVTLGHTRDDQAETLLMGLARGAGLPGLSGMRRVWVEGGVTFHRPLLTAGRDELRDWLRAKAIAWIDDPSNNNPRFTRIRARQALVALAPLGITAETLAEVAGHLASAQDAVAGQVQKAAERHFLVAAGALQIGPEWRQEPAEVQRQLAAAAIAWLSQEPYAPRGEDLARFIDAMGKGGTATLHGCRLVKAWLVREANALGPAVPVGALWDGRWRVTGPSGMVKALGDDGLRQYDGWRGVGLPREVLAATPAVWDGNRLLAAPLAGWPEGWVARLDAPGHLFRLTD